MLCLSLFVGCASTIAKYNPVSYQYAVSLKVESLELMDKATQSYKEHASEVELLLKNPDRNLLGGFTNRWQERGSLSEVFVTEAKTNVALAFDQIIELESGKLKEKDIQ